MDTVIALLERVASALGMSPVNLLVALIVTLFVMGLVGSIVKKFAVWDGQVHARDKPQQTFTTQTPRQVVKASRSAAWERFWTVAVMLVSTALFAAPFLLRKWGLLNETLSVMRSLVQVIFTSP